MSHCHHPLPPLPRFPSRIGKADPTTPRRRASARLLQERRIVAGEEAENLPPLRSDHACRLARDIASAVFDVSTEEIARPNRSIAVSCGARHVAMYLSHVTLQVSLRAVAADFGRDRTSVAHGIGRIEDRRDDKAFDALMSRLERLAFSCRHVAVMDPRGLGRAGVAMAQGADA